VIILQGVGGRLERLCFSRDSRRLAAASAEVSLNVWDQIAPNQRPSRVLDYRVDSVRFSPDGRKLFLSGGWAYERRVLIHELATDEVIVLPPDGDRPSHYCALTPDGKFLLTAGTDSELARQGCFSYRALDTLSTSLWSNTTQGYLFGAPLPVAGGNRFVLFESPQHTPGTPFTPGIVLRTHDTATGATVAEVRHPIHCCAPVVSDDGTRIADRYRNRVAIFHGEHFAAKPIVLKNDNRKEFTGLAFHPSGSHLAATSNDATIKLYDTTSWTVAKVFTWEIGRMRSVVFSPDGMLAAAGSDKDKVVVWDFDL
jgi:WD40 repeat protein